MGRSEKLAVRRNKYEISEDLGGYGLGPMRRFRRQQRLGGAGPQGLCITAGAEQENAVNAYFGGGFSHLGKVDDGGTFDSEGYQDFQMALVPGADPWDFGFTVTSASYAGQAIDFVLLVKQGSQPEYAYYWEGIDLNIEGFFTSFNIDPADGDFSHFSGLARFSETPVPEPGTLALLGLGLLGLGVVRRRMTAR